MAGPAGHKTTYRMNASLYGVVNLYKGLTFEATGNYAQIRTVTPGKTGCGTI